MCCSGFRDPLLHSLTVAMMHSYFCMQKMGIGGLDKEFEQIFRRAFTTRLFPPAIIKQFGQQHVKGAYSNRTGCHMAIAFDQTHLASSRFF